MNRALPFGRLGLCAILFCAVAGNVVSAAAETDAAPKSIQRPGEIRGTVVAAYDNELLIVKQDVGYVLVRIKESHWNLGLSPGDEVMISGRLSREKSVKEILNADEIKKLGKTTESIPPLRLTSIREAAASKIKGKLLVVRGTIEKSTPREITVKDSTGSIAATLLPQDNKEFLWQGLDVVVIGTLKPSPLGNQIEPIAITPAVLFRREGEPEKVQKIRDVLRAKPLGKMVKVEGRLALFLGQGGATVIYDGQNQLIVRPAEKYLSFEPEAGQLVHVVGVFGFEEHRGREYGALKEARVDPPDLRITKPPER